MSVGGGICFGPLMASLIARWFTYVQTFYFFAAYIFVFGIASMYFVPSRVNRVEVQKLTIEQQFNQSISYWEIVSNRRVVMDLAITVLAIVCLTFVDPVLGVQLQNMGMADDNVGIAFAVMGAGFSFGAPTAGYLCGKMSKIAVLQLGLVCLGFSELLVGPS